MVPPVAGCVWINRKTDKTFRFRRRAGPLQRRREVLSLAGESPRDGCSVGDGAATRFMALSIRRSRYELGPCSFRRKSLDLARPAV